MTSTFTPNIDLEEPANGDYSGDWNIPVNANWTAIDTAFGGRTHLNAVSLSGTVALTASQCVPRNIAITGVLTANINYQFPTGLGGFWSVYNNTTGAFTITFSSFDGGTTVVIPQNYRTVIVCDTTGVQLSTSTPAVAAGSTNQIQINNAGALSASSALSFASPGDLSIISTGAAFTSLSGSTGLDRAFVMQTSGADRWWIDCNGDAESGSNSGSNLSVLSYTDAGAALATTLLISRATGVVQIPIGLTLPGTAASIALAVTDIVENANIQSSGLGPGTLTFQASAGAIIYYRSAAGGNWTTNITFSGSATLNSVLAAGQAMTCVVMVTQGSTAYYCTAVQVDGVGVSVNWQGGSAPTAGNPSGIDVYTFTVIKVGSGSYTVLGSQTQF